MSERPGAHQRSHNLSADPIAKVDLRECVIVPAFNEERSIASVVRAIRAALPSCHVLVVNDGSQDATATVARAAGATVLSLPVNLGIGGAVQSGFRYAKVHDFDIALQIDGDGQHDPSEAHLVLEPVRTGRVEMAIGSRWLGRGDYAAPAGRRSGMRMLAAVVRWRTGQVFTDTTSGFRAVGRRGIELFSAEYPTDFPEVEAIILAKKTGLTMEEVGVQMEQRTSGTSSIGGVRSLYYMARVMSILLVDSFGRNGKERK